jgi:hypothetical protein
MEMPRINYCCVCGYDLSIDKLSVNRYVQCPCCAFFYGIEDIGEIDSIYYYREKWLQNLKKKGVLISGSFYATEIFHQLQNIMKNDLNYYFLPDFNMDNPRAKDLTNVLTLLGVSG